MTTEPRPVVPGGTDEAIGRAAYSATNWGNEGEHFNPAFFEDVGRDFRETIAAAGLSLVAAGYEVHPSTLPVICEEHEESDWNGSTIERRYYQTCPYCGDRYGLGMHPPPDHSLLRPRPGDLDPLAGGDR